jgi:hypothetical protein
MRRKKIDESLAAAEASAGVVDAFETPSAAAADTDAMRRGILVRVAPNIRRELKLLSIERGSSMQHLMIQAINELLVKNGRRPIA